MTTLALEATSRGSVVAPAGCGKTQAIVELVKSVRSKPALVLTHTNAGVAALRSRLIAADVPLGACRLFTIDAWSQRIVRALPMRAEYDAGPLEAVDYRAIKQAALRVIQSGALDQPIRATYSALLVDEYQDCDHLQHMLILELAGHLPVRVFGDPLQAIFDFAGSVEWSEVEAAFPPLDPLAVPWRWKKVNCGRLGGWLLEARAVLHKGEALDLSTAPTNYVHWVARDSKHPTTSETDALRSLQISRAQRLLIIGHTTQPQIRREFARRNPGVRVVERADLPDLAMYARRIQTGAPDEQLETTLKFAESVMTNIGCAQLLRRIATLRAGRARKAAELHEQTALRFLEAPSPSSLRQVLGALSSAQGTRTFRRELLDAMMETLSVARDFTELPRRAAAARDRRRFGARVIPHRAIGTTLLLKGLEADHTMVLDADSLESPQHLYVAITRGSRSLTVMSANRSVRVVESG